MGLLQLSGWPKKAWGWATLTKENKCQPFEFCMAVGTAGLNFPATPEKSYHKKKPADDEIRFALQSVGIRI